MEKTEQSWKVPKLWVGEEKEDSSTVKTLFVGDSSKLSARQVIKEADKHKVDRVYFGHTVDESLIWDLENKVHIVLEVTPGRLSNLSPELAGFCEIILRVPKHIDAVKKRRSDEVVTTDFNEVHKNRWKGQMVYDDDEVVLK